MSSAEGKLMRRRLANAFLSTVVSISMVLLLVGLASMLLVNAGRVTDYFKEHLQVSVLLKTSVSDDAAQRYQATLEGKRWIRGTRFVSKEQGRSEMEAMLGEGFLDVFATSPIPASIDVTLKADYVSADSIEVVKAEILSSPLVEEVEYQQSLLETLNQNLGKISLILGVAILLLLFISFVLINNTVRLNVFARRFTIHTMRLVGATRSFIRAPFLLQAVFQGLFSAIIAIIALLVLMFVVKGEFVQLFQIFSPDLLLEVMGIMIACGVLICVVSTYFVVGKLVALSKDELYF